MTNIIDEFVALIKWKVDDAGLKKFQQEAESLGGSLSKVGGSLIGIGAALSAGVTLPIVALGKAAMGAASELEDLQTSFSVLLGDREKAAKLAEDIQKMGASTPYESRDLAQATKTMLSFGIAHEKVLPIMARVGDVALGNKDRFSSLSLQMAKMTSLGRLQGDMLNSMVDAGFNPLQTIAKQTGKTVADLTKELEKGKISAEMVFEALRIETSKGGKFFNGMLTASETLSGRISTLKDDFTQLLGAIGTDLLDTAKTLVIHLDNAIKLLRSMVDMFTKLPKPIKAAVYSFAAIVAAIGPILLALGGVIAFIGAIAEGVAVIVANWAVISGILATIGAVFSEIILPILAIAAAIAAVVAIFAVLKNDFDVWKSGGKSALSTLWEGFESLKQKALDFWAAIRPTLEMLGGLLLASARLVGVALVAAWDNFKRGVEVLWAVAGPMLDLFLGGLLAIGRVLLPLGQFLYTVLGPAFQWIGGIIEQSFGNALRALSLIWDSAPVRFIRDNLKKLSDFGYSGEWNNGGSTATSTNTRYTMAGASNSSTYNAGGFSLSFGGTNASPEEIRTATSSAMVDGFRMVERNNGGRP